MIGTKIYKPVENLAEYSRCADWCNETQKGMIVDKGDYYECIPIPEPSENEILEREKAELEQWLRDHDYIGIKIATGRATVDEYAEEIEEMKLKAEKINEIDRLLASDSVID